MADDVSGTPSGVGESLDFNLEELDDKEFDLPSIDTVPTLESILNEPDNESVLDDEDLPPVQLIHGDSLETSSVSSQESLLSDRTRKKDRSHRSLLQQTHGSILRPSKLKNISAQLLSAADRVDAGMPTAMAVSNLIAIGTSHGLVLVFDPKQVLKWCLGSTAVGAQYGSVSSLSFNRDCTRLLSGFAKGQITMWDLTTGKLLRTIVDAHPSGTAVLHVKFTDSFTVAVCSDSGGSVFELEFKRLIGVRTCDSRCLFSGSRGEVCIVEPLHMNYTIKDHPMQDVMILAMGTLSKVLLVSLRPQLKVMFTHPLKGDSSTLPLLAWQFVIIQVSERDRVIDPVLAFARDSVIYFYQVVCNNPQDIKCQGLQKMEVPYRLLSIQWMNPRTLVCLDTAEKLHVIDVRSEEELEVIDISDVQLVYGSSHFKSLATGGNVSQALAYAGGQACYQSVISYSGQLFLLGTKTVHVMSLRTWRERIDVLVKQSRYQDALALALSFYEGRAKAVLGLSGSPQKKREIIAELMLDLLFEFVDLSMTQFCPDQGKIEELEEYYQTVVPVCVDYCLHLGRTDILFGRIYERFGMDVIARGTFLECLEPYIMNDKLSSITPIVMKDFVEHYETRGMLDAVEACIVHLSVSSLDIHQIVNLCWNHCLYDAIIYVYNKGMEDFTTPLEDLLTILGKAVGTRKQLTDSQIKLGNKLLVYISCCLAGRAYPLGDIPEEIVQDVKTKGSNFPAFAAVLREDAKSVAIGNITEAKTQATAQVFDTITCTHTKNHNEDEPVYPHLRSLLHFDTREFLNVLALAFEEEEFNTPEGIRRRQTLVDILLKVMVESVGFSPTQVGILFTFLARQMARHENTIVVNQVLFEQVLEFLSNPGDESRHEERQQALLELLNAGGLQQFDETRLLHLAENAKFFRVCELLYERRREFDKILSCYLRDSVRKYQAFGYITNIMRSSSYSEEEKLTLQKQAMAKLQELVEIDCKQAAQMVITGFATNLNDIVGRLSNNRKLQFQFLQGVILYKDSAGGAINTDRQISIDPEIYELYIDLLCQFKPGDVANYVKMTEGYRLEQTLAVCRRHKISDAMAFLLEKAGDVQGAFSIILENLQGKLKSVTEILQDPSQSGKDLTVELGEVQAVLLVIIQLCQRNSNKMDEAGREALWFPLLEAMMSPQRKIKDVAEKHYVEECKELTHHVLNSMMGYIALPAILQKIMQDPAYNTGKFGEVKELILGMLETYNYEETLMTTCKNLLYHDLHLHLSHLTAVAGRSYIPRQQQCNMCSKHYSGVSESEAIIVFRCGHSYHTNCLQSVGSVHLVEGEELWVCYLCSNTKRGRLHSTRFHKALSTPSGSQSVPRTDTNNQSKEFSIDPQAIEAFENFRRSMKTPSRLAVLMELSKSGAGTRMGHSRTTSSILQNERFQLRLAPPPLESS